MSVGNEAHIYTEEWTGSLHKNMMTANANVKKNIKLRHYQRCRLFKQEMYTP